MALNLKSEWARALGQVMPANSSSRQTSVLELLDLCDAKKEPRDAFDALEQMVPMLMFLENSQGKMEEDVLPHVLSRLPTLEKDWQNSESGHQDTGELFQQMLGGISSVLRLPSIASEQLSGSMKLLLSHLLPLYCKPEPQVQPHSAAHYLASALSHLAHVSAACERGNTPSVVNASDALALLEENVSQLQMLGFASLKPVYLDSKPVLILCTLVQSALHGPGAWLGASMHNTDTAKVTKVLSSVVDWAVASIRAALLRMRQTEAVSKAAVPTGAATRATAKLAVLATAGLSAMHTPLGNEGHKKVEHVMDAILEMCEACVASASDMAPGDVSRDKVLSTAATLIQDCTVLMTAGTLEAHQAAASISRLKTMLLASANMVPRMAAPAAAAANGGGAPPQSPDLWSWDITKPLGQSSTPSKAAGWGAQHFCCSVAETLSSGLAACWKEGHHPYVQSQLIPHLSREPREQQAIVLTSSRVYMVLDGDNKFASMTMVFGIDAVSSGRHDLAPEVLTCISRCYAVNAAESASNLSTSDWVYSQVADLMTRLYRDTSVSPERKATLATNLAVMARGMKEAPESRRRDVQMRLLTLFSELGMKHGSTPVVHQEMVALLPALAQAFDDGSSLHSRSILAAGRLGSVDLSKAHKQNAGLVKLLRNFWLHASLMKVPAEHQSDLGLVAAATPMLLISGASTLGQDVGQLEMLKMELGARLAHAGAAADPAILRSSLAELATSSTGSLPVIPLEAERKAYLKLLFACELSRVGMAPLPPPGAPSPVALSLGYLQVAPPQSEDAAWFCVLAEKVFRRYLARIEEERSKQRIKAQAAAEAILSESVLETKVDAIRSVGYSFFGRAPVSPIANSSASAFFDASSRTFSSNTFVPAFDQAVVGGAKLQQGMPQQREANPDSCLEDLCLTLVHHLANSTGQEEGVAPQVVQVASSLLKRLLEQYPGLRYNSSCLSALLEMLEAEEGEVPLGQLRASTATAGASSAVWKVLQSWVYAAASRAPGRTEALLHQFLGSEGGLHNIDAAAVGASRAANAASAAMRRSSDLLNICADARKQRTVTAPGLMSRTYLGGTNELARKQYFTGVVVGLQIGRQMEESGCGLTGLADNDVDAVAVKIQSLLNAAMEDGVSMPVLEHRYLAAAALLASGAASPDSAACYSLMCALCEVPLRRLTVDMMRLASFAITWVSTAAAVWLVPLATKLSSAWCTTVDDRRGLFSGESLNHGVGAEGADDSAVLQGLYCHWEVLVLFSEMWDVVADKSDGEQAAVSLSLLRLFHHSLIDLGVLCAHPASVSARFRLLHLALRYCISNIKQQSDEITTAVALLMDRIVKAAAYWFMHPSTFSAHVTQSQADEFVSSVTAFKNLLSSVPKWPSANTSKPSLIGRNGNMSSLPQHTNPTLLALSAIHLTPEVGNTDHPVWGRPLGGSTVPTTPEVVKLLNFLLANEIERLTVWAKPLDITGAASMTRSSAGVSFDTIVKTAFKVHPRLAVALVERFPSERSARVAVEKLLASHAHEPVVQSIPEASLMLATPHAATSNAPELAALSVWAPAQAVNGLELLSSAAGRHTAVKAYAVRCILNTPPEQVVFFLPQLVQILRHDEDGAIQNALLEMAHKSDLFAHQLIWALKTEEKPPLEEFNPEVKRSGWQPPKDFGLWEVAAKLQVQVFAVLTPASRAYWEAEDGYFNQITSISGILKKLEKDERKGKIAEELQKFEPSRPNLYIPTNPDCRVVRHIPTSGTPMQSAAKVPILVAFEVQDQPIPTGSIGDLEPTKEDAKEGGVSENQVGLQLTQPTHKLACIFKVGDDCRQDVLALQVIHLLKGAFVRAGLELYLRPYGCLPTGYGRGIIEVVPNTQSRAAMGELSDRGLYEIFQDEYGAPGTIAFESARRNFIASEAGYAIASFLLQAKDRHNGNILIDAEGRLVHIDFGFILEISPGGNMGFESAAFKLSHEMTQLLDPGNTRASAHFNMFLQLCIRGYLAARTVAEPIIASVALMAESGLPCYGRGAPVENLRKRFHLEMTEKQAAQFMFESIQDSYQKWTTKFYDYIQALQNKIPY